MSKSKIWLFGCSYTQGHWNYRFDHWSGQYEYVPYGTMSGKKIPWDDRFHEYFCFKTFADLHSIDTGVEYELKNFGRPGHGMRSILYHFLREIDKFEPGDTVIIGATHDNRDTYIVRDLKIADESKLYIREFTHREAEAIVNLNTRPKSEHVHYKRILNPYYDTLPTESLTAMADMFFNVSISHPKQLYLEREYIYLLIDNLKTILTKLGVTMYRWDSSLWRSDINGNDLSYYDKTAYFENSHIWSDGDVMDYHWSPNGNRKAGRFFKWCVDQGYDYFDKSHLKAFDDSGYANDFQYIPYSDIEKI